MKVKASCPAFALLFMLCLSAPLAAQDEIASMVPKMQALLKNVACPPNASAQSCASFHKLVNSGSPELTAQFAPAFMDPLYLTYVVFENSTDKFWVISTGMGQRGNGPPVLHMASYGEYQEGQMVTGALSQGDLSQAEDGTVTWSSSKDGVSVSYFRGGTLTLVSRETWTSPNGTAYTLTISVEKGHTDADTQVPETITLESPTQKATHSGMALEFTNP